MARPEDSGYQPTRSNSLPAPQSIAPRAPRDDDWFEDVTAATGVSFTYRNGREGGRLTILETVGGGLAIIDFDGDGLADLFCAGGGTIDSATGRPSGRPCALFRQSSRLQFVDVTSAAALETPAGYSHACLAGDINSDGFPDVVVSCYGGCSLFLNCGDGTFRAASEAAALHGIDWATAAALGDYDHDGHLDLFVAQYVDWKPSAAEVCRRSPGGAPDVCPPQNYRPLPDRLYRNLGDGRFQNVSDELGIRKDG
jgi:hypothetical protein